MDAGLLAPASILNQIFSLVGIPSRFATLEIRSKISYSIPEFCEMTSLGRSTVYEMLASKRLPARKCGSRTIITRADAISFFQSLPSIGEDA